MFTDILIPTGLNNSFLGKGLSFSAYVQHMREIIIKTRPDLQNENADIILQANSPFEWWPENHQPGQWVKKGVLLIHGLYDSPFRMMDIGKYFLKQGFLVRAILLPGHGTVPGDLLNVRYQDWLEAVDYGITSLQNDVDEIHVVGFSMGGALAIHAALHHAIKKVILIAPALKATCNAMFTMTLYRLTRSFITYSQWYKTSSLNSYAKYESFPYNAAFQCYYLMQTIGCLLAKKRLTMPLFIAASTDDETISTRAITRFFSKQPNANNRLLLYTNNHLHYSDDRIEFRPSLFSKLNVVNFSHPCLIVAPDNPHYGIQGDYQDFLHYPNNLKPNGKPNMLGAVTKLNLRKYALQRLGYNPDFAYLINVLDKFIANTDD